MPYGLFDYIDGSFHTMGASVIGSVVPSVPATGRFSFVMPSGKVWTLSKQDDARAREFYCGTPGPVAPTPVTSPMPIDDSNIADLIYCTGGEGVYDGKPTFWKSSARKGCKTNNAGESMPYAHSISRDEYLQGMGMAPSPVIPKPPTPVVPAIPTPSPVSCPPSSQEQGLILQAKGMGYSDAFQEYHGGRSNPNPLAVIAKYKNCPIYPRLMSAYMEEYRKSKQTFGPALGLAPR